MAAHMPLMNDEWQSENLPELQLPSLTVTLESDTWSSADDSFCHELPGEQHYAGLVSRYRMTSCL